MAIDRTQLETDLLQFAHSRGPRYAKVDAHTDLLDSGLLDSLLLMDLIFHLEEMYGIRFGGDQVNFANFRTIFAIVKLVLDQSLKAWRLAD